MKNNMPSDEISSLTMDCSSAELLTRALRILSSEMAGLMGQELFEAVCLFLTNELDVDYAFVGLSEDDRSATTLAMAHRGKIVANVTYNLAGTPCADVSDQTFCIIEDGVAGIYPQDLLLAKMGVKGYAGVRLSSLEDEPIGMLSVMSTAPFDIQTDLVEGLLRLMGLRVQTEVDRVNFSRTERSLRVSHEQLENVVAERTRELRASEQRIRDFAESSSDWFWAMGPDLRFTFFSPRVEQVVGAPPSFHIGKTREELAGESSITPKWRKHLQDLKDRKPFRDFRYVREGPEGQLNYLSTSGKPIFDDDGEFAGYVGTGSDLTNRVQAENEAQLANERMAAAVDAFPAPISLWDPDDRLVIANRIFKEHFGPNVGLIQPGTEYREFIGGMVQRGMIREAIGREEEWLEQRCARHANPGRDFEQMFQDDIWFIIREHRLPDGGMLTISTDITRLKRAEAQMRLSQRRLEDFGSVAADWFWEQDQDLRFTYVSQEIPSVIGMDTSDTLGKTREEIAGREGNADRFAELQKVLLQRLPFNDVRFEQVRPDGSLAQLSISGKPLFAPDGKFQGYRGAGRDITHFVEAEEALVIERDRAEAANRAKSEFLAQMSHDFRTPLNAILGFSQMIAEGALGPVGNPRYQEYAGDIFRSGQLLLDFANNLLDISRIEAGELTVVKKQIDICGMVSEVSQLMAPRFKEKSLSFVMDVHPDATTVQADRLALWHMLTNLFSNAVKFTPENGKVTLLARQKNGEITITVTDTGIGFDPQERKFVLTPFGRGQNAREANIEGVGLGLPIVKAMVEAHDGRFELSSRLGCGTEASLIFPLVCESAAA